MRIPHLMALLALPLPAIAGENLSLDALLDLDVEPVAEVKPLRGQDPRYTRSIVDGVLLPEWPSPDLDLPQPSVTFLPAQMLEEVESLTLSSADLPAAFGGGANVVRTRAVPTGSFARIATSLGYNTRSTGVQAWQDRGGAFDAFGFDDGSRAMGRELSDAFSRGPLVSGGDRFSDEGWSEEEMNGLVDGLEPRFGLSRRAMAPDMGLSAAAGGVREVGGWRLGWSMAGSWDVERRWDAFPSRVFAKGDEIDGQTSVRANEDYAFERSVQDAQTGLFGTLGATRDGHELQAMALFSGRGTDEVLTWEGYYSDDDENVNRGRARFDQRSMLVGQVRGEDRLGAEGAPTLHWAASVVDVGVAAPDTLAWDYRQPASDPDAAFGWNSDQRSNTSRAWETTRQTTWQARAAVHVPFVIAGQDGGFDVGAQSESTRRAFVRRQLAYEGSGLSTEDATRSPDELFVAENTGGDGGVLVAEDVRSSVIVATSPTLAGFARGELALGERIDLTAGLRVESWRADVRTAKPFGDGTGDDVADVAQVGAYPSLSLVGRPSDTVSVGLAYARTVNRPTLRELSTFRFYDPVMGILVEGNPALDAATLDNVDGFVQLAPTRDSRIRLGGFAKRIDNPIEAVFIPGATPLLRAENARSARTIGAEVAGELRVDDVVHALPGLALDGSFTLVDSRIELEQPNANTNQVRPLRGQAPWVVDVGTSWEDRAMGTRMRVGLVSSGPRVFAVGTSGVPDQIIDPFHDLRASFSQRVLRDFRVELEASNLLNSSYVTTQGVTATDSGVTPAVARRANPGTTAMLRVSWEQ